RVLDLHFFFQAEDGIRDRNVTGVQTCALPILATGMAPKRMIKSVFNCSRTVSLRKIASYPSITSSLNWLPERTYDKRSANIGSPHSNASEEIACANSFSTWGPQTISPLFLFFNWSTICSN